MQDKRFGRKQSPIWKLPSEELELLVRKSMSLTEVLNFFNLTNNGACMATLKKILKERNIDFSHLSGGVVGWNKGIKRKRNDYEKYLQYIERWKKQEEKGWVGKGYSINSNIKRYLREKYSDKCERCQWSEKNLITNKIPLQVDHIDGDASNCKEDNLKLLCPNCHSLTPTFGRLNKSTVRKHR